MKLTRVRWRRPIGHDTQGQICRKHSRHGLVCGCDEVRDRAARLHRPGSLSNGCGGYACICGGSWLTSRGVCFGDGDYE